MRHRALIVMAVLAACSCSRGNLQEPAPRSAAAAKAEKPAKKARAVHDERQVGDYWVHKISGSFAERAMVLTEKVVEKSETDIVLEYTLEDDESTTRLLVRQALETDEVLDVRRVVDGAEEVATLADYEALMAKTAFVPDSNEGFLDRSVGTCLVGPSELDCETKSYRVMIGDREAKLDVTESKKYPGRDIAGEISTEDGDVIYRAELLESGQGQAPKNSVASK
jgi:hypothetical protein